MNNKHDDIYTEKKASDILWYTRLYTELFPIRSFNETGRENTTTAASIILLLKGISLKTWCLTIRKRVSHIFRCSSMALWCKRWKYKSGKVITATCGHVGHVVLLQDSLYFFTGPSSTRQLQWVHASTINFSPAYAKAQTHKHTHTRQSS